MRFPCLRVEGGLLAPDLLDRIYDGTAPGQKPADFGLSGRLESEIAAAWQEALEHWEAFQHRLERLPETDPATTVTRDQWVIPLLSLLGYELVYTPRAAEVEGKTYAISHRAGAGEGAPPVHVVGCRLSLERRPETGRPRLAPHSLVQEYLNRTEHLWGVVTNGFTLRLLRATLRLTRPTYIEFDLREMMAGKNFADFSLFYRLAHRSRLPQDGPSECWLERYYVETVEQGGRVRDHLRDGVEEAIKILGRAFLQHPYNEALREKVRTKQLGAVEYYQQLLRLIYRLLFLMVAEERELLTTDPNYREYYSVARLRRLCENRRAWTDHGDLWESVKITFRLLADRDLGRKLGLSPLNGPLFEAQATKDLNDLHLTNRAFLEAIWYLSMYRENDRAPWRRVNYAALDVEELGSIYESLLDFHPVISQPGSGLPEFTLDPGTERKSTGSYYTPRVLVEELVASTLVPVMQERLAGKSGPEEKKAALLSIKVCDPACGSGHFLLAAARRLGQELARIQSGADEPAPEEIRSAVREVIAHCIYGVDKNPMAVELCKVALWIEGHTPGKPLTFLDHRIRCGDSLVGVLNLTVLEKGIPDKAYDPVEGDDKAVARSLAKRNRQDRSGQLRLRFTAKPDPAALLGEVLSVLALPDDTPEVVQRKAKAHQDIRGEGTPLWQNLTACHLWTGAFFAPLTRKPVPSQAVPTSGDLFDFLAQPKKGYLTAWAWEMAEKHGFFHWPLEFPEVFEQGGFDVVLCNPPYDVVKENRYLRSSPMAGTGNLFAHFVSRAIDMLATDGAMGFVVPLSLACGDRFEIVRRKLYQNFGMLRTSHYSIRPAKLFPDVDQRITLLRATRRGHRPCHVYSTRLYRWHPGDEQKVITRAEYAPAGDLARGLIPKVAGEIGASIYTKIKRQPCQLASWLAGDTEDGVPIYYHAVARYWIKAYNFVPFFQREGEEPTVSTKLRKLVFRDKRAALRGLCLLNSSLFYYWWLTQSDEFDVLISEVLGFGVPADDALWPPDEEFDESASRLMESYRGNAVRRQRRFSGRLVTYDEFRPRLSLREIWAIDDMIAPLYELTPEEIKFLKTYDLEFRTDEE